MVAVIVAPEAMGAVMIVAPEAKDAQSETMTAQRPSLHPHS
jgi:hypothetical protein